MTRSAVRSLTSPGRLVTKGWSVALLAVLFGGATLLSTSPALAKKKKVVVTAKEGTELPFDVKDVQTVFWDGQRQLKEDLKKRIRAVVKTGIGAAANPIG